MANKSFKEKGLLRSVEEISADKNIGANGGNNKVVPVPMDENVTTNIKIYGLQRGMRGASTVVRTIVEKFVLPNGTIDEKKMDEFLGL